MKKDSTLEKDIVTKHIKSLSDSQLNELHIMYWIFRKYVLSTKNKTTTIEQNWENIVWFLTVYILDNNKLIDIPTNDIKEIKCNSLFNGLGKTPINYMKSGLTTKEFNGLEKVLSSYTPKISDLEKVYNIEYDSKVEELDMQCHPDCLCCAEHYTPHFDIEVDMGIVVETYLESDDFLKIVSTSFKKLESILKKLYYTIPNIYIKEELKIRETKRSMNNAAEPEKDIRHDTSVSSMSKSCNAVRKWYNLVGKK